MSRILFTILSLVLSSACLAQRPDPLCVLDPDRMPESWRPSAEVQNSLNPAPWSESEAKDAEYAIKTGLDEMIDYFKRKPSAVPFLWDDSIEALIGVTNSSASKPEFDAKVRDAARNNLTMLITPYLNLDPTSARCDEFERLLPLAIFAHRLYPPKDARTDAVTERTNAAYRVCGSLEDATDYDIQEILADKRAPADELYELYIWCLWFIEAELFPDIELPVEARGFSRALWKYFETYRLAGASEFEKGARDDEFIEIADLATHIVHIPSGMHRFPLFVDDLPGLYRFHRENIYPVLQTGYLDLLASFVDSLRQYGCTAENDVQVRDGTRYLLKVFHEGKDRWMAYRREGETDTNLNDYHLIHKAWTGVLGLRVRQFEQPNPGTYGGIVRSWLPHPRWHGTSR
jgi:hypothetical protein